MTRVRYGVARRAHRRRVQREWIQRRREAWFAANGPCRQCGSWEQLELDHIDRTQKVAHQVWSWSKARRDAELKKCQPLCRRCHLKKTVAENMGIAADIRSDAGFSSCRTWRYWLSREWDSTKPLLVVIGLNPSTADETADDPTIRRCISYAKAWGFGKLVMLNLFAYRATDPDDMKRASDPVGSFNDAVLRELTRDASMVLGAWGAHGGFQHRAAAVCRLLDDRPIYCLGTTRNGHPKHPLYLRADEQPRVLTSVHLP